MDARSNDMINPPIDPASVAEAVSPLDALALFGGAPAFVEPLHVGRPNIGNRARFLEQVGEILDRRWLTNSGPVVRELEARVAELLGVRHCLAICNGTVALEIAAKVLGLSGEVIVPSFTFVATAHALEFQGITPVFCDIDPVTHNIDPRAIEALITPRTTGIVGVHTWGRPCDTQALQQIAERHGLRLMFDAAHAFACSDRGTMIGNFGDLEVLSFHATKFLNSLEGGAIVTNDDDIARQVALMRNFGFAGYDDVVSVGTNGKMNEICAAMGLSNLEEIDAIIDVNRRNYDRYRERISEIPGLSVAEYDATERSNFQYVVVEVDAAVTGVDRDAIVRVLQAENVLARRYFYPACHNMEPYRSRMPGGDALLPQTAALVTRVMSLPNGTSVDEAAVDRIAGLLALIVANGAEATRRIAERA
jgi:dTDP-4-amino-4,6-dideoxygalactose transaminase